MAEPAPGLGISDLFAGYEGGVVIDGVSLAIAPGEAVALLGRNGVGKTTLLRVIMGLVRAKSGTIQFAGNRVDRRAPFEIARGGIGYVPQGREVFADLTVEQNLLLGNLKARNADAIYAHFPALAEKRREPGGRLSGGQQQQLAIGRALMADPKLLLLDEPSEGIQPSIVAEIGEILAGIVKARGMALLLVEQNIDMALRLCERALFMDQGRIIGDEPTNGLRADPRRVETYLAL